MAVYLGNLQEFLDTVRCSEFSKNAGYKVKILTCMYLFILLYFYMLVMSS
jgi:hypothetical protein